MVTGTNFHIDVVIVTYNSSSYVEPLIRSLLNQSFDLSDIELIIHDNCSSDDTVAKLHDTLSEKKRLFRNVTVFEGRKNIGFGRANNHAMKNGNGKYIFLLNPDTEIHKFCLNELLTAALNDERKNVCAWEARQIPYEHPKIYDPVTMETPWVSCAAVLFKRSFFERVGGFDPKIFLYGEDIDISFRLRACGAELRYVPKAVVTHHSYSKPFEIKPSQFKGITRSNLYIRTRFGTWKDILKGIRMQIGILVFSSRQQIEKQRLMIIRGLVKYVFLFAHFRFPSYKVKGMNFYNWEYTPMRIGAFYDISHGINLKITPKVSVLIRTTGRESFLSTALKTVSNQTYPNIEVIVVEDGKGKLQSLIDKIDYPYIKYKALGKKMERCVAGNEAMKMATGDYFIFLDDDDLFFADHIEQLVAKLISHNAEIAFSFAFEIPTEYSSDGNHVVREEEYFTRYDKPYSFLKLLNDNYIPNNTVMFHRSLFEDHGGFDEDIPSIEDWNLWVRYSLAVHRFYNVPKTTALYRFPLHENEMKNKWHERSSFRKIAREKHSKLVVKMTVGELLDLVKEE